VTKCSAPPSRENLKPRTCGPTHEVGLRARSCQLPGHHAATYLSGNCAAVSGCVRVRSIAIRRQRDISQSIRLDDSGYRLAAPISACQCLGCGTFSPPRICEQYRSESPVAFTLAERHVADHRQDLALEHGHVDDPSELLLPLTDRALALGDRLATPLRR